MIEIGMSNIYKNYGYKTILKDFNLEVLTGEKVAIVGRNGAGKSTILKMIAGIESPDKGSFSLRKKATLGMLEQIPTLYDKQVRTRDILEEAFGDIMAVKHQLEALEEALGTEKDYAKLETLMNKYSQKQDEFVVIGGYEIEEKFSKITRGFGIENLLDKSFNILSGGQKTIVNLAATLLKEPDILLLDEPTNHLDVKTLEWFEEFLSKCKATVLMVSHDRAFLDKVATKTVLLDMGTSTVFMGNYSFCLKEQERLLLLEFKDYKNQQKQITAMKAAIKRYRQWGNESDNSKFFRKAKELEKRLEKIEIMDKPQLEKPKLSINISGEAFGKEVVKIHNFDLAKDGKVLFEQSKLLITRKERLCISGDNGTGKTSLIKAIIGEDKTYKGEIVLGNSVKLGYIPQEIRFEDQNDTVLETFRKECIVTEGEARGKLAKFYFCGENVFKKVGNLSGGEKVILKLAILVEHKINFLILDEPTNHIDIDTREILEDALLEFGGTVLFVSHDRFFVSKIATRIVVIEDRKIKG